MQGHERIWTAQTREIALKWLESDEGQELLETVLDNWEVYAPYSLSKVIPEDIRTILDNRTK